MPIFICGAIHSLYQRASRGTQKGASITKVMRNYHHSMPIFICGAIHSLYQRDRRKFEHKEHTNYDKIKGINILITGGGSGIGKIMGRIVLEKGAKSLTIWDVNEKNMADTLAEVTAWKGLPSAE